MASNVNGVPHGLWVKCTRCQELLYQKELERDLKVCRRCGFHFRLSARERIAYTTDPDTFAERDPGLTAADPLSFPGYAEKLRTAKAKSALADSVIWGTGAIDGQAAVLAAADFAFMGGSMGSVAGEKISRALEHAADERLPAIVFCTSGGARMQEGIVSLMQMAKTSAAVARLDDAGGLFVTVFTDPLTAGVLASYASLGDIIIAEPGALVGFAGPRVVERSLKIKTEPTRSEFHYEHGMIDMIVPRRELRPTLSRLLGLLV